MLEQNGVQFPPGASANYVPSSGKLIVRNTEANLDLVDRVVDAALPTTKKASGLLPLKLELNGAGRLYSFEGFYAPASVGFHYVSWWDQARRGWMWWAAGGIAFFAFGRLRPWRKLLWGALVLTFLPLWAGQSLTGLCNALLAGWIVAFLVYQIATRLVFRVRVVEVETV